MTMTARAAKPPSTPPTIAETEVVDELEFRFTLVFVDVDDDVGNAATRNQSI